MKKIYKHIWKTKHFKDVYNEYPIWVMLVFLLVWMFGIMKTKINQKNAQI